MNCLLQFIQPFTASRAHWLPASHECAFTLLKDSHLWDKHPVMPFCMVVNQSDLSRITISSSQFWFFYVTFIQQETSNYVMEL